MIGVGIYQLGVLHDIGATFDIRTWLDQGLCEIKDDYLSGFDITPGTRSPGVGIEGDSLAKVLLSLG